MLRYKKKNHGECSLRPKMPVMMHEHEEEKKEGEEKNLGRTEKKENHLG
jgi:hypothetical protein